MPPQQDNRPDFIPVPAQTKQERPDFIPHTPSSVTPTSVGGPATPVPSVGGMWNRLKSAASDELSDLERPQPWNLAAGPAWSPAALKSDITTDLSNVGAGAISALHGAAKFGLDTAQLLNPLQQHPTVEEYYQQDVKGIPRALKGMYDVTMAGHPEYAGGQIAGGVLAGKAGENVKEGVGTAWRGRPSALDQFVPPEVKGMQRDVTAAAAVRNGKVSMANEYVRKPLAQLQSAVTQEVGRHAQSVLDADKLDMYRKGITIGGLVTTSEAAAKGLDTYKQIYDEMPVKSRDLGKLIGEAETGKMSMTSAKALTSEVGRTAARFEHTGQSTLAAPLWALYGELHKATAERAAELDNAGIPKQPGTSFSGSWRKYASEHSAYHKGVSGMVDDLLEGDPEKALDKFGTSRIAPLLEAMKKYGIDSSTLKRAYEQAPVLQKMLETRKGGLMGKIAMMMQPGRLGKVALPSLAGGIALGAAGVPYAHFIAPIVIAAYLSKVLDRSEAVSVLQQLQPKPETSGLAGPSAEPIIGAPEPRAPQGGGGATPAAPPQAPPPSAAPPQGSLAQMIQDARTMQAANPALSKALTEAASKRALASQVEKMRSSREGFNPKGKPNASE